MMNVSMAYQGHANQCSGETSHNSTLARLDISSKSIFVHDWLVLQCSSPAQLCSLLSIDLLAFVLHALNFMNFAQLLLDIEKLLPFIHGIFVRRWSKHLIGHDSRSWNRPIIIQAPC